jgi:peptide chain release factor
MEKYIQITSGRGPAECCWVVAQVLKFLLQDWRGKGLDCQVIQTEKGPENGTLFSALIAVKVKPEQLAWIQEWEGSILWIGQSRYRRYHKRKNWFIGIKILEPLAKETLQDRDIEYQAVRSGGPGGQHVNKVSTAIRAKHLPSGLSVLVSEHRSQWQNKKLARQRLEAEYVRVRKEELRKKTSADWQNHNELQRGNPVKVFTGMDFREKRKTIPGSKGNRAKRDPQKDRRQNKGLGKREADWS